MLCLNCIMALGVGANKVHVFECVCDALMYVFFSPKVMRSLGVKEISCLEGMTKESAILKDRFI